MMHMTFYWGTNLTLLFDFWKTESFISYSLTLLVCLLFSAFYQYLENFRIQLQLTTTSSSSDPRSSSSIRTPLLQFLANKQLGGSRSRSAWVGKASGAVLFGINSAIGYMLMLAVMSFNGGVLIAVVVGLSLGYLLFRSSPTTTPDQAAVVDNSCACA